LLIIELRTKLFVSAKNNYMKCPVCKEKDLVMSDRQGIEIDYCTECRGVWLDRGELDKIIERSGESFSGNSTHYKKEDIDYKSHKHPYPQKKKSIWGEILDF